MIPAHEAIERLKAGNLRFVSGTRQRGPLLDSRRAELAAEQQKPFAAVLGCSDSRVPVEMVFDQGLGDLFVIRVAGNIVAPSQLGSVEFAADRFGTQLAVVLGHTSCGAVQATLEELGRPPESQSPNLRSLVRRIRPALESLLEEGSDHDPGSLVHEAVRRNVAASVRDLGSGSEILSGLIARDRLRVVGAVYALDTGVVEFL